MELKDSTFEASDGRTFAVRCYVNPGKFQLEPIWTRALYEASSWADGSIYDGETWVADFFRNPGDLTDDTYSAPYMTESELDALGTCAGAILFEDSYGFVTCELYETDAEFDAALATLNAQYDDAND